MTLRQVLTHVVGVFLLFCVLLAALLVGFNLMNQASTFKFLAGVVVIMFTLWLVPQIAARMFRRKDEKQGKLDGAVADSNRSDVSGK